MTAPQVEKLVIRELTPAECARFWPLRVQIETASDGMYVVGFRTRDIAEMYAKIMDLQCT